MNDTHGATGEGWYGFDLDGTLAVYDKWQGIDHIGEPVKPMVDLIKKLHDEGKVVKIVTARVAPRANPELNGLVGVQGHYVKHEHSGVNQWFTADYYISKWCEENLGFLPEIVYQKDHLMLELYDDRVKQVEPNKGILVEDEAKELVELNHRNFVLFNRLDAENLMLQRKLDRKVGGFFSGLYLGIILMLIGIGISAYVEHRNRMPVEKSLQNLEQATVEAMQAIKAWKED